MPNMNKDKFKRKLQELNDALAELNREVVVGITEDNAEKVKKLKEDYDTLNANFLGHPRAKVKDTLSEQQQAELKAVRAQAPKKLTVTKSIKINQQVEKAIAAKEEVRAKIDAEIERRKAAEEAAQTEADELLSLFNNAADLFNSATPRNYEERFAAYKEAQKKLNVVLPQLPHEARVSITTEVGQVSQKANQKKVVLDKQFAEVKQIFSNAVEQASQQVENMTVQELFMALLPGAAKEELARLLNDKVQEIGYKKVQEIEGGENASDQYGALVLSDLPPPVQGALIQVIINQLAKSEAGAKSGALVQFAKAMEQGLTGLMSGEKTHLSLVFPGDKGVVQSVNIDIRALLQNPTLVINQVVLALYKAEADAGPIIMTLTSAPEVAALMTLQGADVKMLTEGASLALVAQKVIAAAGDAQALSLITHQNITHEALVRLQSQSLSGGISTESNPGLAPEELIDFTKAVLVLLNTGTILNNMVALERAQGMSTGVQGLPGVGERLGLGNGQRLGLLEGITFVPSLPGLEPKKVATPSSPEAIGSAAELGRIEANKEIPRAIIIEEIEEINADAKAQADAKAAAETKAQKLNDARKTFMTNVDKLKKIGYEPGLSTKAYAAIFELHKSLIEVGNAFFDNPTQESSQQFKSACDNAITTAYNELKESPSIWNEIAGVLKAVAGVVLAIVGLPIVIPALIVSSKFREGYKNTFFKEPPKSPAAAGMAVDDVKNDIEGQQENIDKIVNNGPK